MIYTLFNCPKVDIHLDIKAEEDEKKIYTKKMREKRHKIIKKSNRQTMHQIIENNGHNFFTQLLQFVRI